MWAMLMLSTSAQAAYDVTIAASGASSGGAWVGNTWTPSASGSTVLASEIATHLSGGPTIISTAGAGADNGDIFVNSAVSWSANQLTLTSARNINIKASLNGSGTASLYLQYGFGTGAGGYYLSNGAQVNLPAGGNFSTQLNATGLVAYTVITDLGGAASSNDGTLQGMVGTLGGKYALGADIDASTTNTWNANAGFTPVGTDATKFTGSFDGLGHTITGLTINRTGTNYVGLFGYATGTLRNVGLLNSSISAWLAVGTLAGRSDGAVSYCYADGGSVTAQVHMAGGLLGGSAGATSYSYANVSVNGLNGGGASSTGIGGLIGMGFAGLSVSNSYATGSVNGGTNVGGLVGQQQAGTISNSYATGAVTGAIYVGGLTGGTALGGIANVSNSYWDTQTSGRAASYGGTGKTTAEMKQLATFTGGGWDIDDAAGTGKVWRIYGDNSYPLLRHYLTPLTVTANNATTTYSGTAYSGGNGVTYSTAPNANLLGTVSYGGTSQGAINVGSYVITPAGLYSNQKGYDIAYVNGVLTVLPSYTAASATGSGNITATFSGGGAGCLYTVSQYIPLTGHAASPPVGSAPVGVTFPHGLFDFTTGGCTAASTLTMTITYPQALPAGAAYWKYGPSPAGYNCSGAGCAVAHWYQMPPAQAVIAGNTVTLTITDGGVGDDDLTANGVIVDQGGPGVPGGAASVPTLSEWVSLLLAGLIGLAGMAQVRRRPALP